jgi:hypothetical protein
MPLFMKNLHRMAFVLYFAGLGLCHADYHTNTITTPDGNYVFSVDGSDIDTDPNPTIELVAGVTNILIIDTASFHPVVITSTPDTGDWYDGADAQVVNAQPINLTTPASGFPTTLYYMCYFHGFYGEIHLTAPGGGTPPPNTILQVYVGTNIVMTSTGTSTTWAIVPEFSSNLVCGAWSAVPSYTNSFANGTNTTVFPRLDPVCGPNVFLRIKQQQN